MNERKRKTIYKKAFDKWGERAQIEMAQEEATELALACRKLIRSNTDNNLHLLGSEIADVEIMIEQMKMIYPMLDGISHMEKIRKLERLDNRLDRNVFTEKEENE